MEGVPAEALDNVLPPEVLELVFCRVPFLELWGTCRLVCQRWNRVITRARVCNRGGANYRGDGPITEGIVTRRSGIEERRRGVRDANVTRYEHLSCYICLYRC